jgi:2-keto-3-deoxy-L-rhamnonate aldolase RhmA
MNDSIANFRKDLDAGKKCIGMGITLSDPLVSEAIADSADFLWIDLEHSTMSPEVVNGHLLAARSKQKPGLVRLPAGSTAWIKSALDAGADGIIVPQVRGMEEVKNIVEDCRYAPQGRRGFGPRVPSNYGRSAGMDYIEQANAHILVAVMIETAEAVDVIEQITAIAGLDAVVIGPADLALALGEQRNTRAPRVEAAMRKIIAAARSHGKYVGAGMGADLEYALYLSGLGVQWLQVGGDYDHMIRHFDGVKAGILRNSEIKG